MTKMRDIDTCVLGTRVEVDGDAPAGAKGAGDPSVLDSPYDDNLSTASFRLPTTSGPSTPSFPSLLATRAASLLTMTFSRPGSGRNRGGMLSHVLRPMTTALINLLPTAPAPSLTAPSPRPPPAPLRAQDAVGATRFVTRAKYPISFLSCGQGSVPALPMPREGVAARMRVSGNVDAAAVMVAGVVIGSGITGLAEADEVSRGGIG